MKKIISSLVVLSLSVPADAVKEDEKLSVGSTVLALALEQLA